MSSTQGTIKTANMSRTLPTNGGPGVKSPVETKQTDGKSVGTQQKAAVKQADFDSHDFGASGSGVVRVSQSDEFEADTKSSAEENPFAEFLQQTSPSQKATRKAAPPVAFDEPAEDESAEELFSPKNARTKRPAAANAAKPSTPVRSVSATNAKTATVSDSAITKKSENVGPQSPGVTVQWIRRGNFNVGQECAVDLVVQNTSKAVVRSVMTEAVIPSDVEVLEANPAPMDGSDTPTWTFGELKPGETRTIAMKMIPRQRGDVRLDAFVRMTGFSSAEFSVQEPMIGVAVTGPEVVEVGEQVGYVVRASNPGTGVASNVIIQAAIPEGLEHRSGSILSIEIGTLNPGESRQARLSLTAVKGGAQKLAVRAVADGDLRDETVAEVTVAEPKLKISITGPAEQLAGRTNDFKMVVANSGNVHSANVRAKYRIPEGFEYVSADRGGKYNKADHSIEWFVGTLQPDDTSEFKLTLRATEPGELLHQAGVISEHGQVTMCDYSTIVEGMAALDLKIVPSEKNLNNGDEVTWEVRIRNSGSRSATNVGMSCELPAGMELVEAHGPSEHIAENGVMVFRSLPSIDEDAEVVYSITAHCLRAGDHRLRLRIASESISEPLIGEESATVVE